MAARGVGGGVKMREETRTRLTRTSGVGLGCLETAPPQHSGNVPLLALSLGFKSPTPPSTPVSGEGIPDYRPEGLLASSSDGPSELSIRSLLPPQPRAAQTAAQSPAIKPLGCPCAARRSSAGQRLHRQLRQCAAADYSGVQGAARGGDSRQV